MKKLDALLLRAMVGKGDEEIRRPENEPGVEKGTRDAVLRAETTTPAGARYVLYSQPFPITVK